MKRRVEIIHHPGLGALENAINEKCDGMGEALLELHFLDTETCAIVYDDDELRKILQYRATRKALTKHRNG